MEVNKKTKGINLALNKPTTQSSVYDPKCYDAYGACNGKKTGGFGFHTLKENQPWWQIDLQSPYQILEIRIYNRIDIPERAVSLNVLFSNDATHWQLSYSNDNKCLFGGIDGNPLVLNNTDKELARYVRIQLRNNDYLHLDEVEIYGVPLTEENPIPKCKQDEVEQFINFYSQSQVMPPANIMQKAIMNMLSKLRIYNNNIPKIRVGSNSDGGYVISDDFTDIQGVISIGIDREVSFDKHFADLGIKVFQYDHTIEKQPMIHKNFVYKKIGLGANNVNNLMTLSEMIESNGLVDGDLILKFDIENAEWDALCNVSSELLNRFRIITCELHHFHLLEDITTINKFNQVISLLAKNHKVIHIHPNNCCGVALVAGIVLPKLIEFSFLRNDRGLFSSCTHITIPSTLDYPNVKSKPEIILTPFHF
jgi:hypothetical protein